MRTSGALNRGHIFNDLAARVNSRPSRIRFDRGFSVTSDCHALSRTRLWGPWWLPGYARAISADLARLFSRICWVVNPRPQTLQRQPGAGIAPIPNGWLSGRRARTNSLLHSGHSRWIIGLMRLGSCNESSESRWLRVNGFSAGRNEPPAPWAGRNRSNRTLWDKLRSYVYARRRPAAWLRLELVWSSHRFLDLHYKRIGCADVRRRGFARLPPG